VIPIFNLAIKDGRDGFEARLAALRLTASAGSEAAVRVQQILADVKNRGDEALVHYMRQWTDPDFSAARIRVTKRELATAERKMDKSLRRSIAKAIDHVRKYQEHIRPRAHKPIMLGGAELGLRFTPVDSVGLTVPGGTAVLFSSVIMLAVPAQVAGVPTGAISVVSPPPTRKNGPAGAARSPRGRRAERSGDISPLVLGTCHMLGIENVYRIGGAQGVAALAFGTESVRPASMIAGPGNVYVQLAKQQLAGLVGSDNGFYGPSEVAVIADGSADPRRVAADLIAQAEHDPGKCFLISWSDTVVKRILEFVEEMTPARSRKQAIERAFATEAAVALVKGPAEAAEVADRIAAEHVTLAVADPRKWLAQLRHGGEFFLGDQTPVAAGDYYAGPSHCLPTGSTARFASGVSAYTFLKRSGTVAYPRQGMPAAAIDAIARLAEAEGLDGHAESARVRGRK
jgi:histidinol dehydrogenase